MSQNEQLHLWTQLLHLDGFQVVHQRQDTPADPLRLTLIPATAVGVCPSCQRCCDSIHRRSTSDSIRDLPWGPQAVELVIRTYQFSCPHCQRFFTPDSRVFVPGAHATERFLEQAARLIRFSDVANAAQYLQVPEKTLERWYYDYVERQRQSPPSPLPPIRPIGIDELKLVHGSGSFVAVVVDHTHQCVLEVLKNRSKEVIQDYLQRQRSAGLLAQVNEVTIDMCASYSEAIQQVFHGQARITIDRFHVMKNFQDHLTAARREIQRSLPPAEAKALKGTRWLWLTNRENLTTAEQEELAALKERVPWLKELSEQRESLRALLENPTLRTASAGSQALQKWMVKARSLGLKGLDGFCKTLENWLDKIANYFVNRASNGRTEGFNHGLRSILWRAFGMFNFEHFRLRVLDRFGRPKLG